VAGLAVVLVLAAWVVQELWGESTWLTAFVTYAPPLLYLTLPAGALLLALLCFDLRAVGYSLLGGLLCLATVVRPTVRLAAPQAPATPTICVMTWNVHDRLDRLDEIRAAIFAEDPDIVCLQEANAPRFAECWPRADSVQTGTGLILTRGRIEDSRVIRLVEEDHYLRSLMEARVKLPEGTVDVLAVHLYSYQLAAALKRPSKDAARDLAEGAVAMRTVQVDRILDWVESHRRRAIVAGDFNTPPRGRLYRRLASLLTDGFAAAGSGFGWTFPSSHPLLRIDYVWTTPDLRPLRCHVPPGGPSDHLPVVVEVALPPAQGPP
jgi:vancomycin resistance protein VanJ